MASNTPSKETAEELQAKLDLYNGQLKQIEELLAGDPSNESLLKLKADVTEVIRLTEDLKRIRCQEDAKASGNQGGGSRSAGATLLRKGSAVAGIVPGSIYEARTETDWLPVRVVSVNAEEDSLLVNSYVDGSEFEVAVSSIRSVDSLMALPREEVTVGMECQAKYYADMKFYKAVVEQVSEFGVKVLYPDYGNEENVPFEYLRGVNSVVEKKSVTAKESGKKIIEIPENLRILPTDTEAEREKKRKKIKQIKKRNRMLTIENERNQKQNSWKDFALKKGKRIKTGLTTGSIFASPESVDGKVGVVNSGKGMTEFVDSRKKYQLNVDEIE